MAGLSYKSPAATITELETMLTAQHREMQLLLIENRILWDLLLLDPEAEADASEESFTNVNGFPRHSGAA